MIEYVYFMSYYAERNGEDLYGMCEFTSRTKIKSFSQLYECANILTREYHFDENTCIIINFSILHVKFSFRKSS